ncbi:MAG: HD domain-containing protein [Candidatus Gracilibacteria bacterium]|nr:HD domain-containing protein [Candidatus Gracilibacteria bacterium]MDD2908647.1 HD domain-containing protein [Candidatus Gracilibacteria bacterium]
MNNSIESNNSIENSQFTLKWKAHLEEIFIDNEYLRDYIENADHGLVHSENVYKKALEIYDEFNLEEQSNINLELIEMMSVFHDIGRFHHKKCDKKHQKCGMAQVKMYAKKTNMNTEDVSKLSDFVKYHDYMSKDLDPNQKEPYSIEGQIARVADKMSVDPVSELRRYWDYGKRIGATLFNTEISMGERLEFSFDKRGTIKSDQLTYFLALLGTAPDSINNNVLKQSYIDWSSHKHKAEEEIYKIMEEEGYQLESIIKVKAIIQLYKTKKHLQF